MIKENILGITVSWSAPPTLNSERDRGIVRGIDNNFRLLVMSEDNMLSVLDPNEKDIKIEGWIPLK